MLGLSNFGNFHVWAVERGGLCSLSACALSRTPRHRPGLEPICDSEHCTLSAARRPVNWQAQLSVQDLETYARECTSE